MSHQSYLCVMIDARNEADPCALKLRGNNQQLQHTAQRISYNATAGRLSLYTQLKNTNYYWGTGGKKWYRIHQ